jgi:uncharacterized damage-inducible protein DinB
MSEPAFVLEQLRREQEDDPWHGPGMAAVLGSIAAADAAREVIPGAHSAWAIVLHLTAWTREVTRRLVTGVAREPEDGDWPAVPADRSEAGWRRARAELQAAQQALRSAVAAFPPERLGSTVDDVRDPPLGTGVTFLEMLHGVVQHDVYHTGQISLLKKALGG